MLILIFPFVIGLIFGVSRLDERISGTTEAYRAVQRKRVFCSCDASGQTVLCDPDGRPCTSLDERQMARQAGLDA